LKKIKVSWSVTIHSVLVCCVVFGFSLLFASFFCFSLSHSHTECRSCLSEFIFNSLERERNKRFLYAQNRTEQQQLQHREEVTEPHNTKMSSLDIFLFSLSRTFCTPFAVYVQIQVFYFSLLRSMLSILQLNYYHFCLNSNIIQFNSIIILILIPFLLLFNITVKFIYKLSFVYS